MCTLPPEAACINTWLPSSTHTHGSAPYLASHTTTQDTAVRTQATVRGLAQGGVGRLSPPRCRLTSTSMHPCQVGLKRSIIFKTTVKSIPNYTQEDRPAVAVVVRRASVPSDRLARGH